MRPSTSAEGVNQAMKNAGSQRIRMVKRIESLLTFDIMVQSTLDLQSQSLDTDDLKKVVLDIIEEKEVIRRTFENHKNSVKGKIRHLFS